MKKVVTILGARPQFIKAAVLSRIISQKKDITEVIVHTGQHFDSIMSDIFFDEMNIPKPKYNLDINGLSHGAMTGQMMEKIEEVLREENPDAVVVYGDTNSTLAGALTAKKMGIKVVHVEAGLRSFNMEMPEEVNRILTDRISNLLLCPTDTAVTNLKKEGFDALDCVINQCGDIMKDAVQYYSSMAEERSTIISDQHLEKNGFVLATIHRQENTDDIEKLESIFEGLERINKKIKVIVPLHPRTQGVLKSNNLNFDITIIDPVGYFDMLQLLKNCKLVVTDSGGLQKEAFFNEKPCIIAREETEWLELVDNGFAQLVGSDDNKMFKSFEYFSERKLGYSKNLYGNEVGEKIYERLCNLL